MPKYMLSLQKELNLEMWQVRMKLRKNLTEIVDYLHDPSKYKDIGASMPKGILLVGPPGTGKTPACKSSCGRGQCTFLLAFRL